MSSTRSPTNGLGPSICSAARAAKSSAPALFGPWSLFVVIRLLLFIQGRRQPFVISHVGVHRTFATLRRYPDDVLGRVLDVTCLAVHAVLRIDLQARIRPIAVTNNLVHARGAIALLGCIVELEIDLHRHVCIPEPQM